MIGNDSRGIVIQDRDRHLLRELSVMRVVDREQVKIVADFGSTTRVNARLLALTEAGLLRRFFLGTRAGGAKALYALSEKGGLLVGVPATGPRRPVDQAVVADFFIEHQLAINDVYVATKYSKQLPAGVSFRQWRAFPKRRLSGLSLIPDGYVELNTPSGILSAFVEVDLGHERLKVWRDKVRHYLDLALTGTFEREFGQTRFRVLVIANSSKRSASIRQTIAGVTDKILWFTTLVDIHKESFFGPVWRRPKGTQSIPFIGETQ